MTAVDVGDVAELLGYLTPEERARLDEALVAGAPAVLTYREFVDRVNPRFIWYDHCERVAKVIQLFVDGEIKRLIVALPPRHSKSEMFSRLLPAYALYRFPDRWFALSSYAAELAYTLSRSARAYYRAAVGEIGGETEAVKHWETGQGGGLWATGVGGPATGRGFHWGLIDDAIKNAEEAQSEVIGRRNRDWYGSTWYTRAEPDAAMCIVTTRWPGPGDIVGYLFELEEGEGDGDSETDEPERWHVLLMEAEKEAEPPEIPASCTLEPDPRPVGAPLCPERYPLSRLKRIRRKVGEFFYNALFQQRPRPREGGMFPREEAKIVAAAPVGLRWVRYWDKAATEGGGKYTAGTKMAIGPDGIIYVGDVRRKQLGSDGRKKLMRQTAVVDGVNVTIWIEQEPGSSGKDSARDDVKLLAGFSVHTEPASGDKVLRADPFAAQWQAGNVRLIAGEWNKPYLDEMEAAPFGKYLDQMDSSAGAYNKLSRPVPTPPPGSHSYSTLG